MVSYFVPMADNAVKTRKFFGIVRVALVDLCGLVLTHFIACVDFPISPFSIALLFAQYSRL